MSKKIFAIALLSFFVWISFPSYLFAQQALDVTVNPSSLDLTLKPGDVIKDKIRVRNNTTSPVTLSIDINKLGPDEKGNLVLQDTKPEDTFISWLKLDSPQVVARPREWTDIPFTLSVPKDAAFGYYYTFTIRQAKTDTSGTNNIALTGAAAVPLLLNVKKDGAKLEASVVDFKANSFINEYLPVDFTIDVKNTGNVHLRPRGNVFIGAPGTKDIGILEVNDSLGAVLPGMTRAYTTAWDDGFIVRTPVMEHGEAKLDSHGKPETTLTVNWNKLTSFRIGPYTAHAVIVYDDGKRDVALEASTTFWVIPYTQIAILLGGIIAVILSIRLMLKRYIASQLKKR